jgi:hypothetical protein
MSQRRRRHCTYGGCARATTSACALKLAITGHPELTGRQDILSASAAILLHFSAALSGYAAMEHTIRDVSLINILHCLGSGEGADKAMVAGVVIGDPKTHRR